MIEKLIKKVVEDAEEKAKEIIAKAEKELQEQFSKEKEKIEREYENRLFSEKAKADAENERKIAAFRMENDKELLSLKNTFIEAATAKIEEEFNAYLKENIRDIIMYLGKGVKEENCVIKIPESAGNVDAGDIKIEKDRELVNSVVVESGKWKAVFSWDKIKTTKGDMLREKLGSYFTETNGREKG